jgi:hypothetical protein
MRKVSLECGVKRRFTGSAAVAEMRSVDVIEARNASLQELPHSAELLTQ